ncbi:DNA mismatch repair protein MutL [Bacteroidia bacterium]|nr:DNA mismatch repair protein MutL [Bacteroidia bacterium]
MSDIIHLLPDVIANQIAAGEVVQRPSSAVKELIENAIDAQARSITLIIKDAGKTLIQVIDDGVGMSETDARMSFERHATSKLLQIDDLFSLQTMGFRGEALASIASVAQVELKTRKDNDNVGTMLRVEGGTVIDQEPCVCEKGTSISVKNLFFNVPARRQFLKSEQAENRHILDEFIRVALINHNIKFEYYNDDKLLYSLHSSNFKQRIVSIFGNKMNEVLLHVEQEVQGVKISGFIGKPEASTKSKDDRFFFVNKRFIKHSYLNHAIVNAYEDLIEHGKMPMYFLQINVEPKNIDVNIHPTKTEVRFIEEKLIYGVLLATVRKAIGISNIKPSIDFNIDNTFDFFKNNISNTNKEPDNNGSITFNGGTGSRTGTLPFMFPPTNKNSIHITQAYRNSYEDLQSQNNPNIQYKLMYEDAAKSGIMKCFQFQNSIIVACMIDFVFLIDQKRAHERIIYEETLNCLLQNTHKICSQKKMFQQTIDLSPNNADILVEIQDMLEKTGWEIEQLGRLNFVVNATPSNIPDKDIENQLISLLNNYQKGIMDKSDRITNIALSTAKSMSIKNKQHLSEEEQRSLLDNLFKCNIPNLSPFGELVFTMLSEDEIQLKIE